MSGKQAFVRFATNLDSLVEPVHWSFVREHDHQVYSMDLRGQDRYKPDRHIQIPQLAAICE